MTHKTPQIKPSDPGLAMTGNTVPDNYSNDDKGAEQFALPLVGRRRKASEAGMKQAPHQLKRQHTQGNGNRKEMRESAVAAIANSADNSAVEMKRTKSAYP